MASGYPLSIYAEFPKLLERNEKFEKDSITKIYTILIENNDTNEPIANTVRGILNGHIILDKFRTAGAQGVMQLMPATARSLGVEDSFDARSNIMGGAKYIAGLLERYQGDTVLALSAYNAGSGNVDKYGGIPLF